MARFEFPGGDKRTAIIGTTGSGKSTCGLWMLAHQRLDARPWVIIDFKREPFFDRVGFPPIHHTTLWEAPPRKPGLYLVNPRPGDDAALDAFLWRCWEAENIGLFIDEAPLMPPEHSFKAFVACIQQGRTKHIPIIACMQRPVGIPRALVSQSDYVALFTLEDSRDFKVIQGFVPPQMAAPVPLHHWRYWQRPTRTLLNMRPVPPPREVAAMLQANAPYKPNAWHPFSWSGRKSTRAASRLN